MGSVDLHFITDNDFSDGVTAKNFAERVASVSENAPSIIAELGVVRTVKSVCLTEHEEPLLLLPDYLAGVYHHADPRTQLAKPVVSSDAARAAVADFGTRHRRLRIEDDDFDGIYPVRWDASGRAAPRERERWWHSPHL